MFARIPEGHLLRRLERALDLSFVRAEVAECYGANGNASVDPVVLMKMMVLLFLDDVASERELLRIIPLRLDYLWFLGFGLSDEIPDHSVLSKARRRWGAEVFEQLFARSVEQCVRAGLVEGRKLHVDASLITADASRNSVVRQVVLREVGKLEEEPAAPAAGPGGKGQRALSQHDGSGSQRGAPRPQRQVHAELQKSPGDRRCRGRGHGGGDDYRRGRRSHATAALAGPKS